jgi:hypothetical protein
MNARRLWVIAATLLIGLSCGGNGGDTTPPTVTSTFPGNADEDVAEDVTVTVTFSEAMDPATLSGTTFVLEGPGGGVSGTVSYAAGTRTASFDPSADLRLSNVYTARITTGAEDEAGNGLAADYSWSFTIEEPQWELVGGMVSPPGSESQDPSMMLLGTTPVVGYRHASFITYLNVWDGSSWGTPVADPTGGMTAATIYRTPDFCVQGSDVVMVYSHLGDATANDDIFYDRIFVYRWNETSGWVAQNGGAEVSHIWTDILGGANAWEPSVACPSSGDPVVAWVEYDAIPDPDTEDGIWIAAVSGSSATRSPFLSRNNMDVDYYTSARTVGITTAPNGDVIAAHWEQHHSEQWHTDLFVTRYSGGAFVNLGDVVSPDWDSNNLPVPALAATSTDVYMAYTAANDTDYTRHAFVQKYDGIDWAPLGGSPLSAFSAQDHYNSINADMILIDGVVYVAWAESDQYGGEWIFVAHWDPAGETWVMDGEKINMDILNDTEGPSLAFSPADGYLYVAFEEYTDGYPHIFVKRKLIKID